MNVNRWIVCLCLVLGLVNAQSAPAQSASEPIRVCVSSTDVRTIVEAVGGDAVEITGFVKGTDDPHVLEPTRRMIEALASADLLVIVGNGLEEAWLPDMIAQARNPELDEGGPRRLDLSDNLRTITGPEGRGVPGSFHPEDNPHFLIDPVEGVKAAGAIAAKLAEISPDHAQAFDQRHRAFAAEVMTEMLGASVASEHTAEEFEELAIAVERGEFDQHLREHGRQGLALGGQLAAFDPFRDTPVVGDHDLWPYLARRYGVRVLGYLEPSPGVPPTAKHLSELVNEMNERDARIILTVHYFDPRHAQFVADSTDALIVPMANNPGSRPGTETYIDWIRYNARTLLDAAEQQAADDAGDE